MRLSGFQFYIVFLALFLLRLAVGFHFFQEGAAKLKSGSFSAQPFLNSAKGPLADYFQQMLDDPDGEMKFGFKEVKNEEGETEYKLDTKLTFLLWEDFVDKADDHYDFGSESLLASISKRVSETTVKLDDENRSPTDQRQLQADLEEDQASFELLRRQTRQAEEILKDHQDQLYDFIEVNRVPLVAHFATADRELGFERDGTNRAKAAMQVDSLRGQVASIRNDRAKQLRTWTAEVVSIWNSLESQINLLAVDQQKMKSRLKVHRPFDQPLSKLKWINAIIPWFDVVIGILLMLGLLTRFASVAGALFLVSVVATQPPWILGTVPTYNQTVELAALLVLFATCAGRMGGLDYFLQRSPQPKIVTEDEG